MKTLLTVIILGLSLAASGQTIVESMQTTDNDKVLAMKIVGTLNGDPFNHKIRFEVAGMTKVQRDSLYQQTLRAIGLLGIRDVPGIRKPGPEAEVRGEKVVFRCETCTGKGSIEVYDNNFLSTRSFNSKRGAQPFFPLTLHLGSGEYRLLYRQKGLREIQSDFSVRAGESSEVRVK